MRAISRTDKHNIRRSLAAAGVLCAAAGGVIALSAENIPYVIEDISLTAVRFMYGRGYSPSAENVPSETVQTSPEADLADTKITGVPIDDSRMLSYGCQMIIPSADDEDPVFIEGSSEPPIAADEENTVSIDHDGDINDVLYGYYSGDNYIDLANGGQVRNLTALSNAELIRLSREKPDMEILADGSPEVLIIHTHTTESYETEDKDWYDSDVGSRSLDPDKNMCAVGREIALKLTEKGIGVIHDTTVHDHPSYNGSYDRSRQTAADILQKYPSIKAVLDIHRDAIERDGTRIAPTTEINGRNAAQVMIICGCDDGTMDMPDFRENFKFACLLQSSIESEFPTLTRPVLFDYRHYNQDMTTGSLLIEVGSHANTLDEALYSGDLTGEALADALLSLKKRS